MVIAHEEVHAGRVAAAYLQTVERRQRHLDREVGVERRDRRLGAREIRDCPSGAQPIATDGPHRVARVDQRRVHRFQLARSHRRAGGTVELGLDVVEQRAQPLDPVLHHECRGRVAEQRAEPGSAAQRVVDLVDDGGGRGEPLQQWKLRAGQHFDRGVEQPKELNGVGRGPVRSSPYDADDPAHRFLG